MMAAMGLVEVPVDEIGRCASADDAATRLEVAAQLAAQRPLVSFVHSLASPAHPCRKESLCECNSSLQRMPEQHKRPSGRPPWRCGRLCLALCVLTRAGDNVDVPWRQVDAFVQEVGEETFNRSFVGRGMRVDICIPPIRAPLFMYSAANACFCAPLPGALHLMHVGGIGANRASARDLDVAISDRVQVEAQGVRGQI